MTAPSNAALERAEALLARSPVADNPYLRSLCDGTMDRDAFVRSQRQFYFAVRYFSRPMAALTARLADSASRRMLIHNLAEEHGLGEDGEFEPAMAHDRTFVKFLGTLGMEAGEITMVIEESPVRAFNLALLGACTSEKPAFAFACLGMIEYMFADISAIIGAAVVRRGWIAAGDLVHYKLHAEIDKRHAAEFFHSVATRDGSEIYAGVEFGHHVFDGLYRSLIASP